MPLSNTPIVITNHCINCAFQPFSFAEDCAKYVVLFLTEQKPNFLISIEQMMLQMRTACGSSDKPHYKQIDTFDVHKYLHNVCPAEDIQSFTWKASNQRTIADSRGVSTGVGETPRSQEKDEDEEDVDYGSRSPSPVHVLFSGQIIKYV